MAKENQTAEAPGAGYGHILLSTAWWAWCAAIVAPALVVDSLPFGGYEGIFAAGGRFALRVAAIGVPIAVSTVAWALAVALGHERLRYTPLLWGVAALAAMAGVSTALALDPRVAMFGFWIDEQGLLVWLLYALVIFLGSQLVVSRSRMEQLAWCVIGTGGLVAAIALLEVAGVRIFGIVVEEWMYDRGLSTMMNPDFLGTFLVMPLVLAIGVTGVVHGWKRWLSAALLLTMAVSLAYTLTRGAWIGAAAGAGGLGLLLWRLRRARQQSQEGMPRWTAARLRRAAPLLAAVAIAAVLVVLLGASPLESRLAATIENAGDVNSLLSGRLTIWSELAPAVAERPLFGAGPANMVYAWQPFAGEGTLRAQGPGGIIDSAHNVPLDLAVQFGLPFAVLAFAGATFIGVRTASAARRETATDTGTAAGFIAAWVAAGLGLGVALLPGVTIVPILALAAALLGVQLGVLARPLETTPRLPGKYLVVGIAIVAVGIGTWTALTGSSALAGNQATRSVTERARRDLAALRIAPWRQGPAMDLVRVTQQMSEGEQAAVGVTESRAHQMLLERDELSAMSLYGAGDHALMVEGNADRALLLADRALGLRPLFVPGTMLKGDALVAQGDVEEGVRYLERAVELEAEVVSAHSWEAPWNSYLEALLRQAESDPAAAETAREVYGRFAERFPDSLMLASYGERVGALSQ